MYQFLVPPQSVAQSSAIVAAAPPPTPGPNLSGFQKSLEPQPTLAVHGFGVAHAATHLRPGTVAFREALRQTLPAGWKVYNKPGVSLQLPVVVTGAMSKEHWTQSLREELKQAGLHGAIWWNQQILTVWTPPVEKMPVVVSSVPKLAGYAQASLSGGAGGRSVSNEVSASLVGGSSQQTMPLPAAGGLAVSPVFTLTRGDLIFTDLQKWASLSGWTVVWNVPEDWAVPNTTTFSGDFQKAVTKVVQALSANGANIHAVFHTANNTVVISGAGGEG